MYCADPCIVRVQYMDIFLLTMLVVKTKKAFCYDSVIILKEHFYVLTKTIISLKAFYSSEVEHIR